MAVTQREIAEKANVSINTVSVVLRGAPDSVISDATRDKIVQIANDLGYRPNPHARALVGAKAPLIKIAHRPWTDYISNIKGATLLEALSGMDRDVMVTGGIKDDDVDASIDALLWGAPEAVVFQYPPIPLEEMTDICTALHEDGIHVVLADFKTVLPPDVPCDELHLDRTQGAQRAMDYLLSLGHRRIGLLVHEGHQGRLEGYHEVLTQHRINERFVEKLDVSDTAVGGRRDSEFPAAARRATGRLLDREPTITALLCSSDMVALGAMGTLQRRGLHVPNDVSVIGFHGEPWTEYLPVPLSTMEEPVVQLAEMTKEFLADRFNGDGSDWKREIVKYDLVERASTGPAPMT
ncbi:MAG: LacI family DNA-binding transcriptional regulator [Armatimonadota bacterium]